MLQEANDALFRAKMTLPAAAKHCGMTHKEMKLTFWEFLKYQPNLIMKSLKTPLRYPGGKSRACTKLDQYIPNLDGYKEYREPFLGGGSVAIHITKKYPHLDIWVNDLYEPLYNFWCELRDNGRKVRDELVQLKYRHPEPVSAKILFLDAKEKVNDESISNTSRAVAFYIVNKCSFSGLTESSSFSKQASENNFSMRGIDKLLGYTQIIKDWKITNISYEELLTDSKETFTYLDPPYDIKDNLYGNKGGMHKDLITTILPLIVIDLLVRNSYLTIHLS